jgi:hypothetical protein
MRGYLSRQAHDRACMGFSIGCCFFTNVHHGGPVLCIDVA